MCSVNKELILDFKDLRRIDIECAECGTHTTIDVSDKRTKIPGKCPSCQVIFENVGLQQALINYLEVYRRLVDLKQNVTIRVPIDSTQAK